MKTVVCLEQDIETFSDKLPEGVMVVYFNLIGVGSNTLNDADHEGSKLCTIVRKQPGFFILSEDKQDLRAAMHDFVDRFCDAQGEEE